MESVVTAGETEKGIEGETSEGKAENASLSKQNRFLGLRFSVTFPAKEAPYFQQACREEGYERRYADYLKRCFSERRAFKEKRAVLLARLVKEFQEYGFSAADFEAAKVE